MQDVQKTVISQYSNSLVLNAVISSANAAIDPAPDFELFYDDIWNLETAVGYGLDVWGRIVVAPRVVTIGGDQDYFGFQTGYSDWEPFGQAPFYDGNAVTQNYALSDDTYRTLIFVKAAANISACDTPSLNNLLKTLFAGRGRAYVNDYGHMFMRYTFEFYLEPYEYSIVTQSGVLPTPTGVGVSVLQAPTGSLFGFSDNGRDLGWDPFNQGVFLGPASSAVVGVARASPYQGSGSVVGVDFIV